MTELIVTTGSANRTEYRSPGEWGGKTVWVHELAWLHEGECCPGHELEPMTYFGDATGGLWCPNCCGVVTTEELRAAGCAPIPTPWDDGNPMPTSATDDPLGSSPASKDRPSGVPE